MNNYQKEMYALQDKNGNLIGLDYMSGNYPYVPDNMNGVWLLSNPKGMQYQTFAEYKLVKVKISVEEV